MVVDLAKEVLYLSQLKHPWSCQGQSADISNIKPHKELGYDEIYQFYKNHLFCSHKKWSVVPYFSDKKCSTYKLYFKLNCLGDNPWLVYSKDLEGGLCKACVLFDPVENNVNQRIFVEILVNQKRLGSMLKYNITTKRFYVLDSSWKHMTTPPFMSTTM